ncbi:phosphate ABC transporter substrate-binding protein PstS [Martelella mediterranea]|uniref:Phosphate-binding protein PstS n=1 Tax=Martelella mediterranea TaxID=293089 RepID=A0A4R3NSX8_9HYPH|nr:phosphate ABC transporter substrate-binding protein PstS [Martelella mediterranea]TCT40351.1 phosphate ABC transporter substrate-binding protein (PhoT family) [Martelella mediterranea]
MKIGTFSTGAKVAVVAAAMAVTGTVAHAQDVKLTGSGASFPFPLYSAWFKDFSEKSGIQVNYQSKGSGAGIEDFTNRVVDFAASDAAMDDEEIAKIDGGVVLLPMTAGEVVLAFNLDGVTDLKLPRDVYPKIFLGEITKWNDEEIAAANEGVDLPDEDITVVVRSDSSGTSFNFTNHLAAISDDFKSTVGAGKTVPWPKASNFIAAPGNQGITATIKQTPGAIGYIEYGYAQQTNTPYAMLENQAGNYVKAGADAGKAALASAEFDSHNRAFITDPKGENAYPISTFTWLLFYKQGQDEATVKALKEMINYGLTTGQTMSDKLGYIPLPENVIELDKKSMEEIGG